MLNAELRMPSAKTRLKRQGSADLEELTAAFGQRFGDPGPTHLVRAPGRVNLMGDHIDYNGLSVLPMALQREIRLLYRERDDNVLRVSNTDGRYSAREFRLSIPIEPYAPGDWGNYPKAAAEGLAERHGALRGLDALVDSDIPIAVGLSSSSALVVASALALLHASEIEMTRLALAETLAEAERYVGTRGGGMDQAICLAARRHSASRVDFHPLRLTAHPIPPEWHFIVANSLVAAPKSGGARETYNARARECGEALAGVAAALDAEASYRELLASHSRSELLTVGQDVLSESLFRRFRHVVTEAERVHHAERALAGYDLRAFGRLMSESHTSLRDDFEVSRPELDELATIAVRSGAVGARLTGAGLGGCVVALAAEARSGKVLDGLRRRFYERREFEGQLDDHLFVAEPASAASVTAL